MEDAITSGILKAVAILCVLYFVALMTFGVLEFLSRHFRAIAALSVIAVAWVVVAEPFGAINPDYYVVVPLVAVLGLGALASCYEWLVKLEKLWDRALEARRYRKLQSTPSWGRRPPRT